MELKTSNYNYELPAERIAKFPPPIRGRSKLMKIDRSSKTITTGVYSDLVNILKPGDLLILNDTKVIKARLIAKTSAGKKIELLLLEKHFSLASDISAKNTFQKALYRGKLKIGQLLTIGEQYELKVEEISDGGIASFSSAIDLYDLAGQIGEVPLPPYMSREATIEDNERYQTVFAKKSGSVAAPTASLNLTEKIINELEKKGVEICFITLHVGLGTFLPIRTDNLEEHKMHQESYYIPARTINALRQRKLNQTTSTTAPRRIIAVGTTVTRALEHAAVHGNLLQKELSPKLVDKPISAEADIFIYPGFKFKVIDGLVTNFHAPRSTVLMLVAAFAGEKLLKEAYSQAISKDFAFLSYGDSMIII